MTLYYDKTAPLPDRRPHRHRADRIRAPGGRAVGQRERRGERRRDLYRCLEQPRPRRPQRPPDHALEHPRQVRPRRSGGTRAARWQVRPHSLARPGTRAQPAALPLLWPALTRRQPRAAVHPPSATRCAMNNAADILNHYFAALARQSGMRWTAANSAEIQRAVLSLTKGAVELMEASQLAEVPTFAAALASSDDAGPQPGREAVSFERRPEFTEGPVEGRDEGRQPPTSADQFRQARELSEAQATRRILRCTE